MKANAPEKLYVDVQDNLDDSFLYGFTEKSGDEDIEYIRTDSVLEWLKNKVDKYIVDTPMCYYFDHKRAIEDFKNYMKGE